MGPKKFCSQTTKTATAYTPSATRAMSPPRCYGVNTGVIKKSWEKKYMNDKRSDSTLTSVTSGMTTTECCETSLKGSENLVNAVSIPVGTMQHHRRKLTPLGYQPRLCNDATDYRCRPDNHQVRNLHNAALATASIQEPQQQNFLVTQNKVLAPSNDGICHISYSDIRDPNNLQNAVELTPEEVLSTLNEKKRCTNRVVAATQTSQNSNIMSSNSLTSSLALEDVAVSGPPVLYTVHRVITTAQVQTAVGSTLASTSSVYSFVRNLRDDVECMGVSTVRSIGEGFVGTKRHSGAESDLSFSTECLESSLSSVMASVNKTGNMSMKRRSNVTNTGSKSLPQFQKHNVNIEVRQTCQYNHSSHIPKINTDCVVESNSVSAARPLQNVIPTCVYLMSRVAVHMEIEGTTQCPAQVMLAAALGCDELGIANKLLAQSIFGLWMTSPLLDIQLKSHHRPYLLRIAWLNILDKFSHGNPIEKKFDEPMIVLKRNIFFSKQDEENIKDHRIIELLYEEAKQNVLSARYVMEPVQSFMLGGIQARIELGPYNSHSHTIAFFRENQSRFLPLHVAKSSNWSWLPVSRKSSAEVRLLEQYKRVPQAATTRKLMRKYLEFCWALPFYGAAFFHGQVEQPLRGIFTLKNHTDVKVIVGINERGVFIIHPGESTLLLGLRYEDLSWDFAKPNSRSDSDCLACLFVQFDTIENGIRISKLIQIFSKQAVFMDALISHFVAQIRKSKQDTENLERIIDSNPIQNNGNGIMCNKYGRLTLASFDEDGRCLGHMGSLSISY